MRNDAGILDCNHGPNSHATWQWLCLAVHACKILRFHSIHTLYKWISINELRRGTALGLTAALPSAELQPQLDI